VPCLIDGKRAICDLTDFAQEVAQYMDRRYRLRLFPKGFDGLQLILSRYIENDLEIVRFKVNDTYVIPARPMVERVMLFRHKERKFGKDCIQEWTSHRKYLRTQFAALLKRIDNMLAASPFLLADRPAVRRLQSLWCDRELSIQRKTTLPSLKHLRRWYHAMQKPL
jgi:glutathione S-transferase